MDKMNILIVEDDEALALELKNFLIRWGYHVEKASHFQYIVDDYLIYRPQLILMDINLPFYDGYYWCEQIRRISDVPMIFISSRNDDKDQIMAMAQGGDDYVEKPFHLELLKAKIEALLRRAYQYKAKNKIMCGSFCFDMNHAILTYKDQDIELTRSEKRILTKLFEEKGHIVSRNDLMMILWNTDEFVSDGTLSTMMSRLRSKIKERSGLILIQTKKGIGYYISECDEAFSHDDLDHDHL